MTVVMIALGGIVCALVLVTVPRTKWFAKLNSFESTTTLEEIMKGKDDHGN